MARFRYALATGAFALLHTALHAGTAAQPNPSTGPSETIEVIATRVPETVDAVPVSVTVISGDELRARGVQDLAKALSLVAGVSATPGGDGGPAGSVPEFWGLREFDAFLLVVDEVPWGGAFVPALNSLDLNNVERIEILRGAAPVMYGATSFVGVIHVIHRGAGAGGSAASAGIGTYGSGSGSLYLPLPARGNYRQSLAANVDRLGFSDDRTRFSRGHVLYRCALDAAGGSFRFDFDATLLRQKPASPHPRTGKILTPLVPLDANQNPSDAKLDENRIHFVFGYERAFGDRSWSTTVALTHASRDLIRGFLSDVSDTADPNAAGYSQRQDENDLYLDSHFVIPVDERLRVVAGFDHLFGKGEAHTDNFDYHVGLDGSGSPSSTSIPIADSNGIEDTRNFSGLYAQAEWNPSSIVRFEIGTRLNTTVETRGGAEGGAPSESESASQRRTVTRGTTILGASVRAWEGTRGALWVFADYRNTFKPAVVDFGPEAEGLDILEPETARSYEAGVKGTFIEKRFEWQMSVFRMDFSNLVTSDVVDGRPVLVNSGNERFKGFECEAGLRLSGPWRVQAAYAFHDARFRDYIRLFDGVPTQLSGKRLEMSARHSAAAGVSYAPASGLSGWITLNYVGARFLNMRNTALADSYTTMAAGAGYKFDRWQVTVSGQNLSDTRPPVAESELGDAQYYRLPARSIEVRAGVRF